MAIIFLLNVYFSKPAHLRDAQTSLVPCAHGLSPPCSHLVASRAVGHHSAWLWYAPPMSWQPCLRCRRPSDPDGLGTRTTWRLGACRLAARRRLEKPLMPRESCASIEARPRHTTENTAQHAMISGATAFSAIGIHKKIHQYVTTKDSTLLSFCQPNRQVFDSTFFCQDNEWREFSRRNAYRWPNSSLSIEA